MNSFEKRWFDLVDKNRAVRLLGRVLSLGYARVVGVRNRLYDLGLLPSYSVPLPVIGIGNIASGGNAKTPLASTLAGLLQKRDLTPVVLSRGYGGELVGPHRVSEQDRPSQVGDEPYMLHAVHGFTVVVSRDRVAGARYIVENRLGDIIVLDDGFQHRRLSRDLDLVAINARNSRARRNLFGRELIPMGLLREEPFGAFKRCQGVVLMSRTSCELETELFREFRDFIPAQLPIFQGHLEIDSVQSSRAAASLEPTSVIAFCGIAEPDSFRKTLQEAGYQIVHFEEFPDHYVYSGTEIADLGKKFPDHPLVCTEKDAVKLSQFEIEDLFVCRVVVRLKGEEDFVSWVCQQISECEAEKR